MVFLFWLCLGAMIHTYLIYPFSLIFFKRKFCIPPEMPKNQWPTVAVLIAAYNEEKVIADKVKNSLNLDYEAGKLEIFIGSDGSTDKTNEIVESFSDSRLKLIKLPGRSGKSGVLNQLFEQTQAEILVFSDANVTIAKDGLRKLIRHFFDPQVGVAGGGKYILIPRGAEAVQAETWYANNINKLKQLESDVGGMSGALGSFMAMRRNLFQPYRKGSINDDTVPSIWATLADKRNVWDNSAKAFEESGFNVAEEFRRRIRIGAGNFQTLFRYKQVLRPKYGMAAYTFFSHKVIRWIFPFLMLVVLGANLFLLGNPLYEWLLIGQLLGYTVAFAGWMLDKIKFRLPIYSQLYHFVALNIALAIGFFVYLKGVKSAAWERTEREATA